jgi:hypothetical protein
MTGEVVRDGRYQLLGKLGEGAQGTTFDAVDTRDGRAVAVKRFSVRGAASWKDVELAEREASVLSVLSHPMLPRYFDHFEEDGALYLVMEKVEGESLLSLAKRGGRLSRDDVVRFLRDSSEALAYLHGRSPPVIHRDISPKNVIRKPDGSFAFVDFGAVRDKLKPDGGSTVVGTFGYMAPEQFQGRALPASDVYAVGVTALRLLTGVEPESLPHHGLAIDVRAAVGGGFDPALREVLSRMLEVDPDRRASSIAPLVAKLDKATKKVRPSRPDSRPPPSSRRPEDEESRRKREAQEARRREWVVSREEARRRAREEQRRAQREWKAAKRKSSREWTESARRARREWENWQQRGESWRGPNGVLQGPPLIIAVLGLNVAIIAVRFALIVFVPFILRLLSIVFGPALRDAARNVRDAGRTARDSLRHARGVLRGEKEPSPRAEPEPEGARASEAETETETRPRGAPRPRVRVEPIDRDVIDTTGTEVDVDEEPRPERASRR